MKKFLKHTALFLLPILFGVVILFLLPTDHKRAYHYLTNDCDGRAAWIYQRIYESKLPIDIAFLGSSHTINGINDTLINDELIKNPKLKSKVCNLGYCRFGRDLTYVFMKSLIKEKGTKTFIIEVLPEEPRESHPVFAFLSDTREVIDPKIALNGKYLPNLYNATVSKWMYLRQNLFKEPYENKYYLPEQTGFSTANTEADTNILNTKKERRYKKKFAGSNFTRDLQVQFPKRWLGSIDKLARENNVKIIFLYIPPYGSPEKEPVELDTYLKYGPVWIAPDSIFTDKKNWIDDQHLNVKGANLFSSWVAGKIAMEN